MDYTITLKITGVSVNNYIAVKYFKTKWSNRKVARASIKKIIEAEINYYKEVYKELPTNIEILDIIKTETVRYKQIFTAENEYENFLKKTLHKKGG